MGIRATKPTSAGRRFTPWSISPSSPPTSRSDSCWNRSRRAAAEITTVVLPRVSGAAGTSGSIDDRLPARQDRSAGQSAEIEYDPNRSARIARLYYADGEKRYILAPDGSSRATR